MLADQTDHEKPGIEESYSSATHTSNLKMEWHRRMPVDEIVAAGWSRSRVGAALLRLHSEWDGTDTPAKLTPEAMEALAASYTRLPNGKVEFRRADGTIEEVRADVKAKREAQDWHMHELGLVFQRLKSLPDVRRELVGWCGRGGISGGRYKVAAILAFWLDPTCPTCEGRRWQLVPGTARHSGKACETCHGTGEQNLPHGNDGRKIERYLNDCMQAARASMRQSLKARGNPRKG